MTHVPQLNEEQRDALEWILREVLGSDTVRDIDKASDLIVIAELHGSRELIEQATALVEKALDNLAPEV